MSKAKPVDLPADLVAVVYYCEKCDSKHTFGRDYMAETGAFPDACPGCGARLNQDDRVDRHEGDSAETLEARKLDLFAKRGRALPGRPKPDNPQEIKQQRIRDLEGELRRLKGGGDGPASVRLGP